MTQREEELGVAPRLPRDAAYWRGLERRIVASAASLLDAYRTFEPWWAPWARFGPRLGMAAAAALAAVMVLTTAVHHGASSVSRFASALAPRDPVGRVLVLSAQPPDISVLLLSPEDPQ